VVNILVHPCLAALDPESLRGGTAVVIDLIRASTTIVFALGNGAAAIHPCETVDEALSFQRRDATILLGGERHGVRIEGFDLGNSPAEYSRDAVMGRTMAFTTTNGTRALRRAGCAERFMVASLANLTAAASACAAARGDLHVICAGVDGKECREDLLCAGALAYTLERAAACSFGNDDVLRSLEQFVSAAVTKKHLVQALADSEGGRNLAAAGLSPDLADVAAIDAFHVVPTLDLPTGRLVAGPANPAPGVRRVVLNLITDPAQARYDDPPAAGTAAPREIP
jgi:2-phosphosulfolactate phosphatase